MEYPFSEDKIPQISRITSAMVGGQDFLFPDVISYGIVYHHGLTRDEWNETFPHLYIYCCENLISQLCLIYSSNDYFTVQISDWRLMWPIPSNWNPIEMYQTGVHIGISKGLGYTLSFIPPHVPYQIFMYNPRTSNVPLALSDPVFDIVQYKGLSIYVHGPYTINLSEPGNTQKIKRYLELATGA